MKVAEAIAEILKREGVELLFGYPVNPLFDAAAAADIRTVVVRQERDSVVVFVGAKRLEMRTPAAVKVGMALARAKTEAAPGDFVRFEINGEPLDLLPDVAAQVGGAVLRKADQADDWQRQVGAH